MSDTKIVTVEVSKKDQTLQVKLHGFRFNETGNMIGRNSISKPSIEKEIHFPEGERLSDVLPYRNNGITIKNIGEIEFKDRKAEFTRNMFACGGYSFNKFIK